MKLKKMCTHLYDIHTRFNDNDDHDDYFCAICETRLLVSLSFTFNFIRFAHFTTNARRPCHVAVEKWILIKVLFHFKFRYWLYEANKHTNISATKPERAEPTFFSIL